MLFLKEMGCAIFLRRELPILAVACVALAAGSQSGLPDGKGKDAFERACAGCHELDTATSSRFTRSGWEQTVGDMVGRGAELNDEQAADVVAYLTKNFGKVNVNKASAAQLRESLGLTEKDAQAIVAYREKNGDFKTLDQVKGVPGVDVAQLSKKAADIAFRD